MQGICTFRILAATNYTTTTLDLLWLMIVNLSSIEIAMWIGWNTLAKPSSLKQRLCYMKHIQLPPTRTDVVKKTMKRSKLVAKNCNQQYVIVTYDLAIAKVAKQLQCCLETRNRTDVFLQG